MIEPRQCKDDEYKCNNTNQCISAEWLCDGTPDCEYSDDELNCLGEFHFHGQVGLKEASFYHCINNK